MNFSIFCHYLPQKKENYLWEYFQRYQSYSNKFWVFPSIPFLCGRSPSGNSELKTRYRIYSMACIDPRFLFLFFFLALLSVAVFLCAFQTSRLTQWRWWHLRQSLHHCFFMNTTSRKPPYIRQHGHLFCCFLFWLISSECLSALDAQLALWKFGLQFLNKSENIIIPPDTVMVCQPLQLCALHMQFLFLSHPIPP